ncbi:glycosyltransferase [Clostridium sporogenes]|uniref:Glycosyltransferase n=1 Tax=Clostridium botulinum TaxID=1491 RepID=A0A6M0SWC3_CLOBO|nr:glycosyltransferase [Clostridium sporogenes]NFA59807.1 glycosyltransferase [Clostridium botulinum]NFI72159.1 glycosyltransferase [Clostridium sporogenes]NFL72580.1 glycosyltransferase [Clostridium sporogenes]NFM23697.1 glycosyltransferase [Clostridium sporogenes]NFP60993.1 glycosyltransferase [Clostridium sporogenes]
MSNKKKIVFFILPGLDNFIDDIIEYLSYEYNTKKVIVRNYDQIDEEMKLADICWFEWCDPLVGYGSKLEIAKNKKIICRLHSYEAFTNYIYDVNWSNVDKIIFVAEHIKRIVLSKVFIPQEKIYVIPNGIDLSKQKYKEREKGFNIAYVGYINFKKGPMLLMHAFKKIFDTDNRYKLHIAGAFDEQRYRLYFNQMIRELGLAKNIIFYGWQKDINKWLEDKNYLICTSVLESQGLGIMEAMSKGIRPLIHNFVGAKEVYPEKYVWSSLDDLVNMLQDEKYSSIEYRNLVEKNYSLSNTNSMIMSKIIEDKNLNTKPNNNLIELNSEISLYTNKIINTQGNLIHSHSNNETEITIVTPVYNGEDFLESIFNSMGNQTIKNKLEWILVDDKSKDNSLNKCISLAEKYKDKIGTIKIYSLDKNSGAIYALKFGFSMAKANYIGWISVDDSYVDTDKLEEDLYLLKDKNYDMVFSNKMILGNNTTNGALYNIDNNILTLLQSDNTMKKLAYLSYSNPINGSSLVFSKEAYKKCGGFDTSLVNVDGDWDLLSKAILLNLKFIHDNKTVFNTSHPNQTSRNGIKMIVGSNITRLRILNLLKKENKMGIFLKFINEFNWFNDSCFNIRPIFSYYLIKLNEDILKNKGNNFVYKIENTFLKDDLKYIFEKSIELMDSKSFSEFYKNIIFIKGL